MTFDIGYFIKQRKPKPLPRVTSVGGVETFEVVNGETYKIHTFLASGEFRSFSRSPSSGGTSTIALEYLVLAGGGGGGWSSSNNGGGGGGAGGLVTGTNLTINVGQTYSVVVGAGGSGVRGSTTNGSNSSGFGVAALGGGHGGLPGIGAQSGGSGGGADGSGSTNIGLGTPGQGNNGGQGGTGTAGQQGAGGGGGAGGVGANRSGGVSGVGGNGLANFISASAVGQIQTSNDFRGSVLVSDRQGTGNYIALPRADNILLCSGDFTYEFFARRTAITGITCVATTNQLDKPVLRLDETSMDTLFGTVEYGATTSTNATFFASLGRFFYAAFTRSGTGTNNCSVFIDGQRIARFTNNDPFNFGGDYNRIGNDNVGSNREWVGNISNLRITRGFALYAGATMIVPSDSLGVQGASTAFLGFVFPPYPNNIVIDLSNNNLPLTIVGNPVLAFNTPFTAPAVSYFLAGGGGGGASNAGTTVGANGGIGGGGKGGNAGTVFTAETGLANTGGGGGGAGHNFSTNTNRGGNGGSGAVVIRFKL